MNKIDTRMVDRFNPPTMICQANQVMGSAFIHDASQSSLSSDNDKSGSVDTREADVTAAAAAANINSTTVIDNDSSI